MGDLSIVFKKMWESSLSYSGLDERLMVICKYFQIPNVNYYNKKQGDTKVKIKV